MLILHYNFFNVWVYRTRVAHCTFEITLLQAIMLTLLLVCSFSPKVQSIFWGPRICAVAITLRQILILRLVRQKPRLKWCLRGNCVIPRNALYVIARSNATWQSPGRVTLLIIWWFLSNCQKDTLAIIYNRCVLININTSAYDVKI